MKYTVSDRVRLEVETTNPDPLYGLLNLVQNPTPDRGVWWWTTDTANTQATVDVGRFKVMLNSGGPTGDVTFSSGYMPVTPGQSLGARFDLDALTASRHVRTVVEFYTATRALLSTGAAAVSTPSNVGTTIYLGASIVPASAAFARLVFHLYAGAVGVSDLPVSNGDFFTISDVMVTVLDLPISGLTWTPADPVGQSILEDGTTVYTATFPVTPGFTYKAVLSTEPAAGHNSVGQISLKISIGANTVTDNATPNAARTITVEAAAPAGSTTGTITISTVANSGNRTLVDAVKVSIDAAATFPYVDPFAWTNVLDSSTSIQINRVALDVATLTATLTDPALDPSTSATLAHGRRIQVTALTTPPGGGAQTWQPIFTGWISSVSTAYVFDKPSGTMKPIITVNARDALADLANIIQPIGVADVGSMAALLEGLPIPYSVNGQNYIGSAGPVQVASNPQASLVDQVAVFRDLIQTTFPGMYAIATRDGTLKLDTADSYAGLSYDHTYSDVEVDYDTDSLINSVQINWQRSDGTQVTYGPYIDQNSIDRYGAYSATYTLQGATESAAAIAAYATAVLAANSTPARQTVSMTVPVLDDASITKAVYSDLANRIEVVTDVLDSTVRIQSISHDITPDRWLVHYGFRNSTAHPTPQVVPAPTQAGTDVADTGWVSLAMSGATGTCEYRAVKVGSGYVVNVVIGATLTTALAVGATRTLVAAGGIPSDYCPNANPYTKDLFINGIAIGASARVELDGSITINNTTGSATSTSVAMHWNRTYINAATS